MNETELLQLCGAMRDEIATEDQLKRLDEILAEDAEARDFYLRFMQVHALLERYPMDTGTALGAEPGSPSAKVTAFPRLLSVRTLALAATLVVAAIFAWKWLAPSGPATDRELTVATLLLAEDCEWQVDRSSDRPPLHEGQRLPVGAIQLRSGSAVLRFDSGAELVLSGDTRIELLSASHAALHFGDVVVRAEDGAEGFALDTPTRHLVDLGTEFAVRVEPTGATELHVHEGEVAADQSVVTAGQSLRFEEADQESQPLPSERQAPRFDEMMKRANPRERRDLMTAYEGFHLDEGEYAPADIVNGKGWASPWRLRSEAEYGPHPGGDSSQTMRITHGRMTMAWPVRGGRLGMLELPPGQIIRLRQLEQPIDLANNDITFFSFLAAEDEPTVEISPSTHKRHDLRLTFRSSADYFGESLSIGWSKTRLPRVQSGGSEGQLARSTRPIPAAETVFCVGKIVSSKNAPDEVYFRFYRESDELDFVEPADWDIEFRDAHLSAKLNLLLITASGSVTRYLDEIRIGPTWRSVTPIDQKRPQS